MSNTIQIKRGSGKPANGKLFPYELGYDTTNKIMYIGNEEKKAISLKIQEADLIIKDHSGGFGIIDQALIPELGANRFAFLGKNKEKITIEYSRNSGANWYDYGASDAQKKKLFSVGEANLVIGKADSDNKATVLGLGGKYRLRITIDCTGGNIYTALKKFAIHISTNRSKECYCTIRTKKYKKASDEKEHDWVITKEKVPISGYPGWNIINTTQFTTINSSGKVGEIGYISFEFYADAAETITDDVGLTIKRICAYGGFGWDVQSQMAKNGDLYSYDLDGNVSFPGTISATQFIGAIDASKITNAVSIANGGTGATTVLEARTSLGTPGIINYTLTLPDGSTNTAIKTPKPGLLPFDTTSNIGSSSAKFNAIYANYIYGQVQPIKSWYNDSKDPYIYHITRVKVTDKWADGPINFVFTSRQGEKFELVLKIKGQNGTAPDFSYFTKSLSKIDSWVNTVTQSGVRYFDLYVKIPAYHRLTLETISMSSYMQTRVEFTHNDSTKMNQDSLPSTSKAALYKRFNKIGSDSASSGSKPEFETYPYQAFILVTSPSSTSSDKISTIIPKELCNGTIFRVADGSTYYTWSLKFDTSTNKITVGRGAATALPFTLYGMDMDV